jgi:hypothetical protein
MRFLPVVALAGVALASPIAAQQPAPPPPQLPRVAPSTRATVEVQFSHRMVRGRWMNTGPTAGAVRLAIDYGQPHLRGRRLGGPGLVPMDSVWRLGANVSTTLTTDLDITIGDQFIPHGTYSLFVLPSTAGWKLIVNRATGQWGTDYDATQDLARVDLRVRTIAEPMESLAIFLVPQIDLNAQGQAVPQSAAAMPRGTLRILWGNTELTTEWRVGR